MLQDSQIQTAMAGTARYLDQFRLADGSYAAPYFGNAAHPALSLLALSYVDVHSAELARENRGVLEQILALQMPDGGFEASVGRATSSRSITRVVVLALHRVMQDGDLAGSQHESLRGRVLHALALSDAFLRRDGETHESPGFTFFAALLSDVFEPETHDRFLNIDLAALTAGSDELVEKLFCPLTTHLGHPLALLARHQALTQSRWARGLCRVGQTLRHGVQWAAERVGATLPPPAPERIEQKIRASQAEDGSWLLTTMITSFNIMALKSLGHGAGDPAVARGIAFLRSMRRPQTDGTLKEYWTTAGLWDTALHLPLIDGIRGLGVEEEHLALQAILSAQGRDGRWPFNLHGRPEIEADNDSTAMAVRTLSLAHRSRLTEPLSAAVDDAIRAGVVALIEQQQRDGGWGAWGNKALYSFSARVPDGMEANFVDASAADMTGRVITGLLAAKTSGALDASTSKRVDVTIARAVEYLRDVRQKNGSWWGRWFTGFVGTAGFVLPPLAATGVGPGDRLMVEARAFLLGAELDDGGWGESTAVDDGAACVARGPSSPAQTALAMMGLMASSNDDDVEVRDALGRGATYLLREGQDGAWRNKAHLATTTVGFEYYEAPAMTTNFVATALRAFLQYGRRGAATASRQIVFGRPEDRA